MLKTYFSDRSKRFQSISAGLVILVVASLGTYLLIGSHASTPYVSINAASGTLANGATAQACSGASSGSCVVFGQSIPMDGNVAFALTNPGTPFAASSFWNTLLPSSTPVNTNNDAYINDILAAYCGNYPNGLAYTTCPSPNHGSLATSAYSAPLYVVPASQPYVTVKPYCNSGAVQGANFINILSSGVPIPVDAHAAAGTDEEIQIYQPSTNKYWDFWQFQKDSTSAWEACNGGLISNISQSNGIFLLDTFAGGATASGLPLLGSVVRIEELKAGQIDHVMGLELPGNLNKTVIPANTAGATNGISWPANRSDGTNANPLAIPEGLRFRLNPNLNLDTLNLTPVARTIAVAAQKYGFVIYDTDPNVGIRLGDPTTYTNTPSPNLPNPYTSGPGVGGVGNLGLFNGLANYGQIMANFPWDQLQALPFNYGGP